jgi:hypothetical protein
MPEALLNFDYDTNIILTVRKQLITTVASFRSTEFLTNRDNKLLNEANLVIIHIFLRDKKLIIAG